MADDNANVRHDTLVRPLHESLMKDWTLTLSMYLNSFMDYLDEHQMNFTEAAMILQNSTSFYCKRVDVVYKILQDLVTDVCNMRTAEAEEEKSKGKTRKKKPTKILEKDDLQLLDFVASDYNINANLEKLVFKGTPKQVVLNSSTKALRKAGASVTVFDKKGGTLGCKEEFKIFARTHCDGTVNPDFNYNEEITSSADQMDDSYDRYDDDMRDDVIEHMGQEMCMAPCQPTENLVEMSELLPEMPTQMNTQATIPLSPAPIPVETVETCKMSKPKRNYDDDWKPIPADYKCIIRPFKIKNTLIIPKELLDDEELQNQTVKKSKGNKRKRDEEENEDKKNSEDVTITWIDNAIRKGSADAMERKIQLEKEKRENILALIKKAITNVFMEPDDAMGPTEDNEPDDFDAFMDDNDIVAAAPKFADGFNEHDADNDDAYKDAAAKAIEQFLEGRREFVVKTTDLAQRVSAWHEAIMPVLDAAEARSQFDVHEYGSRILKIFPDEDHKTIRPFGELVVGQPKNEICRYFLSSLMLANTYNLEISKSEKGPLVKDCMQLRLLSKVRHHEEMDEALRITSEDCGS